MKSYLIPITKIKLLGFEIDTVALTVPCHSDKVERIRGMDITIVTSGKNKNETLALLKEFDFPFIENKTPENKERKN